MSSSEQLDKTYLEQVLAEHQELRRLLTNVQRLLVVGESEKRELIAQVCELVDLCEAHFAEEETGGYMHDVIKAAPRLSHRAELLLAQHEHLLESLEALRVLVQSGVESAAWRKRVQQDFAQLARRLGEHESAEYRLVRTLFRSIWEPATDAAAHAKVAIAPS